MSIQRFDEDILFHHLYIIWSFISLFACTQKENTGKLVKCSYCGSVSLNWKTYGLIPVWELQDHDLILRHNNNLRLIVYKCCAEYSLLYVNFSLIIKSESLQIMFLLTVNLLAKSRQKFCTMALIVIWLNTRTLLQWGVCLTLRRDLDLTIKNIALAAAANLIVFYLSILSDNLWYYSFFISSKIAAWLWICIFDRKLTLI